MKGIINGLLFIAMIAVLTVIGGTTYGWIGGLGGFLAGVLLLCIIKRATLFFLIGQSKYKPTSKNGNKAAYRWMQKAYNTTKLAPSFALMYAYMMIRDGKLSEAELILNKVTFLNRKTLSKEDLMTANLNMAIIKWKQDNLSEAIDILEDIYDQGLRTTNLYGTLGYFYLLDNNIAKAVEFNKEGHEYNSDNMIIEDNLGASYIANSELDKAEEVYTKLFTHNPQFIEPYYNYGMLMEKLCNYDTAREYYEKALAIPEKYLSTVTHAQIEEAIANIGILPSEKAEMEAASENVTEGEIAQDGEAVSEKEIDIEAVREVEAAVQAEEIISDDASAQEAVQSADEEAEEEKQAE